MKNLSLVLALLIACIYSNAQTPYYDAMKLSGFTTNLNKGQVQFAATDAQQAANILSKYVNSNDYNVIQSNFNTSHPFIMLPDMSAAAGGAPSVSMSSWFSNNISSLDVTTFADGLAQFLVERAKAELNVAFINKFKKFLDENPEARTLFPETTDLLENILSSDYTTYLNTLRDAFYEDLKNLIYNLDDVFYLDKYDELVAANPELLISIELIQLTLDLESGSDPFEVLERSYNLKSWDEVTNPNREILNTKSAFGLAYHLSSSVRSIDVDGDGEVDEITRIDFYNNIIKDETALRIFLGLLYEQTKDLRFNQFRQFDIAKRKRTIADSDTTLSDDLVVYAGSELIFEKNLKNGQTKTVNKNVRCKKKLKASSVYQKGTILVFKDKNRQSAAFKKLRTKKAFESGSYLVYSKDKEHQKIIKEYLTTSKELDPNDKVYYSSRLYISCITFGEFLKTHSSNISYLQNILLETVEKVHAVEKAAAIVNDEENQKTYEDYYRLIEASIDLFELGDKIYDKMGGKFESGVYLDIAKNANELYKNIYEQRYSSAVLNACEVLTSVKDIADIVETSRKERGKSNPILNDKLIDGLKVYGTFMANIVEAEDASDVKAAFDAAALPVGSSTVKKYNANNWAINAYIGGFYNFSTPSSTLNSWDQRLGFTAPVGISWTPVSLGRGGSLSLFGSLLDVGAIAEFRLSDTGTEVEEKIELGNIFSPGLYLVYGSAWDLPVSLSFGGQYGPSLFTYAPNDPTYIAPSWRWNASLTVDISLFNLHKGRSIKN